MPHCHEGMEEPPVAKRSVGSWRQFLVIALAIVGILAAASVAASFRSGSPPQVSVPTGGTVFYNEACSDCATYLRDELLPALSAANVTPVVVKDYINRPAYRQELRGLNDGLGIPFDLQSHLATFVRDARIGLLYVFAVFLAYLLIGLGLLLAVTVSEDPHLIARVAGVLVIALGAFVLFQPFFPRIPNPFHTPAFAWKRIRARMQQGTQPAAAVAGFLVGLCTFPCSGGIYVAVLGLLAAQTTYWEGLGYLYLYNLAFVLPLLLILLVVSNRALARRTTTWERRHTDAIRQISGAAMIVVGVLTVVLA